MTESSSQWFVAIVATNSEKACRDRLVALGHEAWLASQEEMRVWRNGRRSTVERVVIPLMVFVYAITPSYMIVPFFWDGIGANSVSDFFRHPSIEKFIKVLLEQGYLALMRIDTVCKVMTINSWRKHHAHLFVGVVFLNEFNGWQEVAVTTHEDNSVSKVSKAISKETDRDVDICFFLFWTVNGKRTVWTLDNLRYIFSIDHFKAVVVYETVSIQKRTLPTVLFLVEWGSCKIDYLLKCLPFTNKHAEEFHQVNPIGLVPLGIYSFSSPEAIVKIETINIECNSFHSHCFNKKAATGAAQPIHEKMGIR